MSDGQCTMPSCDNPVVDERAAGGLCETHLNGYGSTTDEPGPDNDHPNPHTIENTTDEERAQMLLDYLSYWRDEFGSVPMLMPVDEQTKRPWITGRSSLDQTLPNGEELPSEAAENVMVDGYEAARRIAEEGAIGFALYAGRQEFGTYHAAFADHDEPDEYPAPTGEPTLKVLSGSGRGPHETYRNDPDDRVRNARVGDNAGEVRAENWYVVVPGSVHPSGGIYHITEERPIATLSDSDLTDDMRPSAAVRSNSKSAAAKELEDADGEPESVDDEGIKSRLETAFTNPHDGGRIEQVYNGRYASAGFDDRSAAEFWLANRLDSWVGLGSEMRVERVMNKGNLQKWSERTDRDYRDSVLAGVGTQDWYYRPGSGANESETAYGREIVATLPNSPRTRAAKNGQNWHDDRHASSQSTAPTQQELYDRVRAEQVKAMERGKNVVLDAIMGGGKTFNFFGALAEVGEKGAYFAPRIKLYEQAVEYAEANGFTRDECKILPSLKRDCPTWRGDHGEEQEHLIKKLYALGATPKTIHHLLGDELKCKQNDTGKCEYEHKCKFDPDEYELLIGHYAHAHVTQYTKGRHCAFDEDPQNAFTTHVSGSQLIKGVNAFLGLHESPPFDGWDDLIQHRNDDTRKQQALAWFDRPGFEFEPDEQNAVRYADEGFHAYAPLAVYTILKSEPLEDGYPFEQAQLPGLGEKGKFFTTSEQDGEHYVEISNPPDLEYTEHKGLICLDGTPLIHDDKPVEWMDALDRPLNHRQVLTDDERGEFLSETQGNVYIQTSEYIKPYSSGRYNNPTEDAALLAAVRETYGDGEAPVVFTDMAVRNEYESAGFVEEGLAKLFDHPGNLRGNDEYGSERVAVQLGSSHHGDHEVRRRAASLGETVNPEGKGKERDYGSELGNSIVYQMREAQSAQNALRVGRDGNGALFVFDTCAFPDWIPVEEGVADVSMWSKTEQAVRDVWGEFTGQERERGLATSEVSEAVGDVVTDTHLRRCLNKLANRGYLEKTDDPDDGRRSLWVGVGLGDLDDHQAAEIDLPEIAFDGGGEQRDTNIEGTLVYTRNVRIFAPSTPKTSGVSLEATGRDGTVGGSAPLETGSVNGDSEP